MSNIFLQLFNISIMASWLIFIIIILRLVFKTMPKKVIRYLWLVVGLRLMLPFSIETGFSLIPSSSTIIVPNDSIPVINTGFEIVDDNVNLLLENNFANQIEITSAFHSFVDIACIVWVIGIVFVFLYGLISYKKVQKSIEISINQQDNIYICDDIDTPFIFGLNEPRIYLPSNINENQIDYILEHEKTHIEYKDHLWKPLGYVLLSIYWFNPMVWIAYIYLCRDIESACDESVIEKLGNQSKANYSETLLNCSTNKKMLLTCPVAFGEVRVKERIQDILNYTTPKKLVKRMAILICLVLSIGFLTEPYALNNVIIHDYETSAYTEKEIEDGIKTVYKFVKWNFQGTLNEIEYDGIGIAYNEWKSRHNVDEIIVFYGTFKVNDRIIGQSGLEPGKTYHGYRFILGRKHGSKWRVIDGGYG